MSQPPEDQTINITQDKPEDSEALAAGSEHVAGNTGLAPVALVARVASPPRSPNVDREAQEMVIDSLRAQVQDLFSQVTQLNGKLVQSYDRVSDLEDSLHAAASTVRTSALQISQLELERTQHLSALNTGLLVEKSQVTAELSRVMEKATEEAARRGQAESARADIEKDLDDLSASLFGQANLMVAQARFQQASSERKVEEAEQALKGAEEAVALMQQQMQAMQAEKEKALERMEEVQNSVGKGKWVERERSPGVHASVRLLNLHVPYQEFLQFVAHLRSIRPASQQPPTMTTLLPLPFLGRLQSEDSDPTIRLDLAPSLNWLSRRSVLSAMHTGELSIEPMAAMAMVQELSFGSYSTAALASAIIPGSSHTQNILCALCGTAIFPSEQKQTQKRPPVHPMLSRTASGSSWSTSLFKNPLAQTNGTTSAPMSPTATKPSLSDPSSTIPSQVYIFRVTTQTGATPQSPNAAPQRSTIYPLCTSGWCLARLRSTCSLWSFVRNGIVEHVWEEDISNVPIHAPIPQRAAPHDSVNNLATPTTALDKGSSVEKIQTLTPKKSMIGGFWGKASSALSAGVERVSSISSTDTPKEKEKVLPQTPPRRMPPPPKSSSDSPRHRSPIPTDGLTPPPLPKRSGVNRVGSGGTDDAPPKEPITSPSLSTTSNFATPQEEPDNNPLSPPIEPPITSPLFPELHAPILLQDKRQPDAIQPPEVTNPPLPSEDQPAIPNTDTSTQAPFDAPAVSNTGVEPSSPVTATIPRTTSPAPPSVHTAPLRITSPVRQAPPIPARPASPTPGPGSRTGSPAPPPLPRRAAARARPQSMAIQAAANNAVAGSLPSPVPRTSTSQESAKEEHSVSPEQVVAPANERPTTLSNITAEDELPSASESTKADSDRDGNAGVPSHPDSSESHKPDEKETIAEPSATESTAEETSPAIISTSGSISVPSTLAEPQSSVSAEANVEATPPPVYTATPAAALAKDDVAEVTTTTDKDKLDVLHEHDMGSYVSDATWEERTWRELVKLRESMFWARVGGVR